MGVTRSVLDMRKLSYLGTSRWRRLAGSSVCGSGAPRRIKAGDRDVLITSGHKLAAHRLMLPTRSLTS